MKFPNIKILVLILLGIFVISSGIAFSLIQITDFNGLILSSGSSPGSGSGGSDSNLWQADILKSSSGGSVKDKNIDISRSFPAESIKEIEIQLLFEDVNITAGGENTVSLHYYGEMLRAVDYELGTSLENNGRVLFIKSFWPRSTPGERIPIQLDLEVPATVLENLDIAITSGDVEISGLNLYSALKVNLTSGDLEVHNLAAKNMYARATSGDLSISNIQMAEAIELNTTSGEIEVTELKARETQIAASSGDVDLNLLSPELDVKTTSGDVSVELQGLEKSAKLVATAGDINLKLPSNQSFNLRAQVTSGDIRNAFSSPQKTDSKFVTMSTADEGGDGEGKVPEITISTTSGDIEISK